MAETINRGTYFLGRRIFFQLLALTYLVVFISAFLQLESLYGTQGIFPLKVYLAYLKESGAGWTSAPGIFWWFNEDYMLTTVAATGIAAALFLFTGIMRPLVLALLYILYLSIVSVGHTFFFFQWDSLMLELGFLAIFFAPLNFRSKPETEAPPSRFVMAGLLFLLFRLMFFSGFVKLASGDVSWRSFTALAFHYETQPLPNPLSWYFHLLPLWWHRLEAMLMFFIELVIPVLLFAPPRIRTVAAIFLFLLQLMIFLSGNFSFFNFQTLALIALVPDDYAYLKLFKERWKEKVTGSIRNNVKSSSKVQAIHALIVFFLVFLAAGKLDPAGKIGNLPVYSDIAAAVAPFRLVNNYGVFAVMTTERYEIIIEGSYDGKNWEPYILPWQPGPLDRMPAQIAPFQPRLDWQMWFVPFQSCRHSFWLQGLFDALLRNLPAVTRLFAHNPFKDRPPVYLRAIKYRYQFTDWKDGRESGAWWKREGKQIFCPATGLETPCNENFCLRP